MPCMCGDICCSSCGPAQGNWRCPICRVWASEVCPHINSKGQLKRQYRKQVEEQAKAEAEAEAQQIAEEEAIIFKALDDGEDQRDFAPWIVRKWRTARQAQPDEDPAGDYYDPRLGEIV